MTDPVDSSTAPQVSLKGAWGVLFAAPVVLGLVFGVFAGGLVVAQGLDVDDTQALVAAMTRHAAWPTVVAFSLMLALTTWRTRCDGMSLRDIGWQLPPLSTTVVALMAGIIFAGVNARMLFPVVAKIQPSFDPSLSTFAWPVALVVFGVSVTSEEVLFRGYAWHQLSRRYGVPMASVVTSAFYAFLTPDPAWPLKVWALLFGLLLCALRAVTQSLPVVIVVHLLTTLAPKLWASTGATS